MITSRSNTAGKLASSLLLLPILGWVPASQAAISFVFDYSGNTADVGFDDPTYGTARKNALATAGSKFSNLFGQYFTNSGTITMAVTSENSSGNTLASAGSNAVDTGSNGFTLGEVVRDKLLNGTDLNGGNADGTVNVNFGINWELDPDAPVNDKNDDEYDFYSTMYHEFVHALGFSSSFDKVGDPLIGDRVNGGAYSAFDSFIVDSSGTNLIGTDGKLNVLQSSFDATVIGGKDNGAFFDGPNAKAANGGNPVGLYTPGPDYEEGSSVSHLDDENPALAGLMMLAKTGPGLSARGFSPIEVGILKDLGYAPVPLPAAFWLFASAIAVLFGFGKRNNREGAATAAA